MTLADLKVALDELDQRRKDVAAGYANGVRDDHVDYAAEHVIEVARAVVAAAQKQDQ